MASHARKSSPSVNVDERSPRFSLQSTLEFYEVRELNARQALRLLNKYDRSANSVRDDSRRD